MQHCSGLQLEQWSAQGAPEPLLSSAGSSIFHISDILYAVCAVSACLQHSEKVSSALFFKYNTQLGPPYQVLVDTNFINFSIKNKVS
jgi:hypothetical protein